MDDILSGKINNTYDAEKIFREIMEDENLLRNYKNFSRKKKCSNNSHNYKESWICCIWTFVTIKRQY